MMLSCQLCGAKSWGPVPARAKLVQNVPATERVFEVIAPDSVGYLCCDNCGSWAQRAHVSAFAPPPADSGFVPFATLLEPPMGPATQSVLDLFKGMMPAPESRPNRLERLVAVIIAGGSLDESIETVEELNRAAFQTVYLARRLENEMDQAHTSDEDEDSPARTLLAKCHRAVNHICREVLTDSHSTELDALNRELDTYFGAPS